MTGLVVLLLGLLWLFACWKIARFVAVKVRQPVASSIVGVVAFGLLVPLPFVDEIVGRLQFQRLCEAEALIWVSPEAEKVLAAKSSIMFSERKSLLFPVSEQSVSYSDASTGQAFYRTKSFHTPGGVVMRAGLNMGSSTTCWPPNQNETNARLHLNELLKRGKQ